MAWLTDWTYRKPIVIAHTADGAQTNYQMKLLVGYDSADGGQVDCNSLVATDFDDLRFTTSDGVTLCDYWIESITGTYLATVWIEIPSIAAHPDDTTIYMYYGNAGAAAVSSGANTFGAGKFDNFEWGNNGDALTTSGGNIVWTLVGGSTVAIVSTEQEYLGIVADTRSAKLPGVTGASTNVNFPLTAATNYAFLARFYKETAVTSANFLIHGNNTKKTYVYADVNENLLYYDGAAKDTGVNVPADAWFLIEINNFNWTAYTYDIYLNGVLAKAGAAMYAAAGDNNIATILNYAPTNGLDMWVDNVIIRKWTATEPTWGSWGAENTLTLKTLTEIISLADITPQKTSKKAISDVITLVEAVDIVYTAAGGAVQKSLSDVITISDTCFRVLKRTITDATTITDSVFKKTSKPLIETITLTDIYSRAAITFHRIFTESITILDTKAESIKLVFIDALSITDTVAKKTRKGFADAISVADSLFKKTSRRILDTLTITASIAAKSIKKTIVNTLTLVDTVTRTKGIFKRTFTEAITILDSKINKNILAFSDVISIAENIIKLTKKFLTEITTVDTPQTATFQPPSKDTFIYSGGDAQGSQAYLRIYRLDYGDSYRALLEFAVVWGTDIPAGATITSATLSLYYYANGGNDPVGRLYGAYRLTRTNWVEAYARWLYYSDTDAWTVPGGDITGTDAVDQTMPASYGWVNWNVLALVGYARTNNINVEFAVMDESQPGTAQADFYSNNYTTDTTLRPKLVIGYTVSSYPIRAFTIGSSISKKISLFRSEVVTISDSPINRIKLFFTDTLAITDSIGKSIKKYIINVISLVEKVVKRTVKAPLIDSLSIVDSKFNKWIMVLSESITVIDSIAKKSIKKAIVNAITLVDSFTRLTQFHRTFTETITILDTHIHRRLLKLIDSLAITDTIRKTVKKTISESITITPSITEVLWKFRNLSIKVLTKQYRRLAILTKQYRVIETLTKQYRRIETMTKQYRLVKALSKQYRRVKSALYGG